MNTPSRPQPTQPGQLIAELMRQHGPLAICAAFLVSCGWVIYAGGLWAGFVVFFSTLAALFKLTMTMMELQKGRGR
jgi:hypothetical protein